MSTLELEQPDSVGIVTHRGASLNLALTFASTLTGQTVILTVRDKNLESGTVLLSLSVTEFSTVTETDDTVTFSATSQEMSALSAGNYYYAIQLQDSPSSIVTKLKGTFDVEPHAGINLS